MRSSDAVSFLLFFFFLDRAKGHLGRESRDLMQHRSYFGCFFSLACPLLIGGCFFFFFFTVNENIKKSLNSCFNF